MATKLEKAIERATAIGDVEALVSLDPEQGFVFRMKGSSKRFAVSFADIAQVAHDHGEKDDAAYLRKHGFAVKK